MSTMWLPSTPSSDRTLQTRCTGRPAVIGACLQLTSSHHLPARANSFLYARTKHLTPDLKVPSGLRHSTATRPYRARERVTSTALDGTNHRPLSFSSTASQTTATERTVRPAPLNRSRYGPDHFQGLLICRTLLIDVCRVTSPPLTSTLNYLHCTNQPQVCSTKPPKSRDHKERDRRSLTDPRNEHRATPEARPQRNLSPEDGRE